MKKPIEETITLSKIVGGGQALGQLADGRKAFVWGGLPDETVSIRTSKVKSKFVEAVVTAVEKPSVQRVEPRDPESYLSTSPWQIMDFQSEQHYKAALIEEAFELHDIVLPGPIDVYSDGVEYGYRNKVEFSWYGNSVPASTFSASEDSAFPAAVTQDKTGRQMAGNGSEQAENVDEERHETLDLAFFRRGSHGKVAVDGTSLARPEMNQLAQAIRDQLHANGIKARELKTLMIRSDQSGNCVWQLYVKDKNANTLSEEQAQNLPAQGGEIIYSDPKSPASVVTKRLASFGDTKLHDTVLDIPFSYVCEGFFQGNVPVYEQSLRDMQEWIDEKPVVDMYSGVGTIGFTIGGENLTLVEVNKSAVDEMKRNRFELGKKATVVEASAETSLDYITGDATIILDPPRAGLHQAVIDRLLETAPERIIYLSCNPVTQARDVALLAETYGIRAHRGYNFFPRTPHIEHLVILDKKG